MTYDTVAPAIDETRSRRTTGLPAHGQTRASRARPRLRTLAGVLLAGLLATAAIPSVTSAKASASLVRQTCMAVSAVLSDGPDPDADPVGYAQAQILPLRQIHTKDAELKRAIDSLATAYQTYVRDNGNGKAADRAVSVASKKVDAICPGATS